MTRGPHPEPVKGTARRLRREGLSIHAIAERLGVPRSTVGDWLRGTGGTMHIRTCWCGERFVARNTNGVYCSPAHARKGWSLTGPLRDAA